MYKSLSILSRHDECGEDCRCGDTKPRCRHFRGKTVDADVLDAMVLWRSRLAARASIPLLSATLLEDASILLAFFRKVGFPDLSLMS